jgi:hypothetical protein
MPYQLKFFAYFIACSILTIVIVHVLSEYGLAVVLIFASVAPLGAIHLGRWLFGRKNL